MGYKREFEDIEKLGIKLAEAIRLDKEKKNMPLDVKIYFGNIKNRTIDKKGQRS